MFNEKSLLWISRFCGGLTLLVGLMVIVGWYAHWATLVQVLPGLIPIEELRHKAEVVGLLSEQGGPKTVVVGPETNLEGSSRAQVGLHQNGENPHEQKRKSPSKAKLLRSNGAQINGAGENHHE